MLIVSFAVPPSLSPQTLTPKVALERLCSADRILTEWFAPSFLSQIRLSEVEQILAAVREELGRCLRAEEVGTNYRLVYERGVADASIALDGEGHITGFRVLRARMLFTSLDQALQAFQAIPGKGSVLVLQGGRDQATFEPETALAVGSAFKLTVLWTLREQINAGRRSWSDVLRVRNEWKSLPSGTLQNTPAGTEVTLQRAAELMISISDNTATDHLIHTVGRESVEALAPSRNRPFMTTREVFILKDPRNRDLLDRYRSGDEAGRRWVLQEAQARPLPDLRAFVALLDQGPLATDIEWFYTSRELCDVISRVADLSLMGLNPGFANPELWTRVAFKGGSEPGVLNFTTFLEGRNRMTYCVAVTWNNTVPLPASRLAVLYGGLLDLLK